MQLLTNIYTDLTSYLEIMSHGNAEAHRSNELEGSKSVWFHLQKTDSRKCINQPLSFYRNVYFTQRPSSDLIHSY